MVLDLKDVVPFSDWIGGAMLAWLMVVACAALAVTVFAWVVSAVRRGPVKATLATVHVLWNTVVDIVRISPRRVLALAGLAIKESIRRRVVVVFAVFILLLLFAGWFLDPGSIDPARLYLGFVLTATTYLVLLLALFLSSLSLPADIKNHTIYTIVTKPVRSSEIVLGRIIGFSVVATVLLVFMGAISYGFVQRGLAHTHQLTTDNLRPAEGGAGGKSHALQGRTSNVNGHRHAVFIDSKGNASVDMDQGHTHKLTITKAKDGKPDTYELGQADGMLLARVPVYGKLAFRDRTGKPAEKGINVGDEWTYRSFIEGGSLAAAVWTFEGIDESQFPKGLPVEMTLGVFRTYKGDIERGVLGTLAVRNPKTGKKAEVRPFRSKEDVIDVQPIPRTFVTSKGEKSEKVDLFKDMVADGKVEVWLQCVEPQQYFGAAQADVYLRATNASFGLNFIKGYIGVWLQAIIVISLGVMWSTFLSGPVAMLATLGTLVGGFFNDFMFRLATGQTYGGGPWESIIRILTQQNVTAQAEPGLRTAVAQTLDQPTEFGLRLLASVLPDFGKFSFSEFVASGFNVPGDTLLTYTCRAFAFVIPVFIAAYLCLKNREVAQQ